MYDGPPDSADLVRQFDAMRQSLGGAPSPASAYRPQTPMGGAQAPPSSGGGASTQRASGKGLVDYGGRKIAAGLVPYADHITRQMGLRLTSGYRDPESNRRANGVQNSWHLQEGEHGALDFSGTARQMQDGAAWARQNGAREVLVHNAGSGQHLHVAW